MNTLHFHSFRSVFFGILSVSAPYTFRPPDLLPFFLLFGDFGRRYLNSKYNYDGGRFISEGIPSVAWCAKELCLSPSYFGNLIKKETGITARDHIHRSIIEMAKNKLINGEQITQIAYDLGFEYPQHLSRLFKKYTGHAPSEYQKYIRK